MGVKRNAVFVRNRPGSVATAVGMPHSGPINVKSLWRSGLWIRPGLISVAILNPHPPRIATITPILMTPCVKPLRICLNFKLREALNLKSEYETPH
jgi:hypothetical protein